MTNHTLTGPTLSLLFTPSSLHSLCEEHAETPFMYELEFEYYTISHTQVLYKLLAT